MTLTAKHRSHILELAARGAERRYQELKAEIARSGKGVFAPARHGPV
jgi:hypothetical protein